MIDPVFPPVNALVKMPPASDEAGLLIWERVCALRIACDARIILDRFSLAWMANGPVPKVVPPADWVDERMDAAMCELMRDLTRRGGYYLKKHLPGWTGYDRLAFSECGIRIVEDAADHYGRGTTAFNNIEHGVFKAMGWTGSTLERAQ